MGNVVSSIVSNGFEAAKNLVFEKANKYIFKLNDHLKDLEEVKPDLEDKKVALLEKLDMNDRNGLPRDERCKDWISKVEAIQPKVSKLLQDKTAELERLSMCGICSTNFFLTYSYGKDVLETLEEAQRLLSSKPSGEVTRKGLPPGIEEIATQRTVGLEKMLQTTWSCLMETDVGILGLYGMGGIGKTTLLEKINQKLLEKKDEFAIVIFVVVTQNLQVETIQNEMGKRLGICDQAWKTNTQEEKTSRIYNVLAKRRFVLLLDDIWEKVDLKKIGIPFPSRENGSKVVFTTCLKDVCGRMESDYDLEVKKLDPENAWELFGPKIKGNTLNDPEIYQLARQVCEKCEGLPLALKVIGETMAYKTSVREWKRAITGLGTNAGLYPEVEDKVLKILKLSYDDLKDDTIKQCFQYCALFPEDEEIDNDRLVDFWIYEGFIDEGGDREEAIDEGYKIIGELVRACLLIPVDTLEKVKMHDVVRKMALWVASKCGEETENCIVMAGTGLQEMPKVKNWNAVTRMSLAKNYIWNVSIPPKCPNLTTLLLADNWLRGIPGEFFLSMPKLVILDLSFNRILNFLPEEVSNLVSLRYLDLSETSLLKLPVGLGKLIQLRYLSLRRVRCLRSISVISSLVNLEMLLLHGTGYVSLELLEAIKLMENLKVLGVSIDDADVLERLLSTPSLVSCIQHIRVAGIAEKDRPVQFGTAMASLRSIEIERCIISDTIYGRGFISSIWFENLSSVVIWGGHGVHDLSWLLFAPNLISIDLLGEEWGLEEIISREKVYGLQNERRSFVPFRKLRELNLRGLEELKSFYWERLELPSLKSMIIFKCPKLKKLPFNKERLKGIDIQADREWLRGLEWEDEATEY